ncbi:MAG: DUF1573 domain-containing protein [Verrucomicrobiales bacterium]|jgi:hypothetical protein|nr:DUF1573 domain-containing protein [Verrucomicrobiales bacterium]
MRLLFTILSLVICFCIAACKEKRQIHSINIKAGGQYHSAAGDIFQFGEINRILILKNNEDNEITFNKIETTCGCSNLALENETILPNATTALHLTLKAQNRKGPFYVIATLFYKIKNETEVKNFRIRFDANAVTPADVEPDRIDLPDLDIAGIPQVIKVDVRRNKTPIQWDDILISTKKLPAVISRIDNDHYEINIKVDPGKVNIVGSVSDELEILLTRADEVKPIVITVPIQGKIISKHSVKPASIFMGSVKVGDIKKGSVNIKLANQTKLVKAEIEDMDKASVAVKGGSNNEYIIEYACVIPESKTGYLRGNLQLMLNDNEKQYYLVIPIVGYLQ